MKEVWLRVILAAFISAMGVVGTRLWSQSQKKVEAHRDQQPIAKIAVAANEVQRRPAERLIWQRSFRSQELFGGEAVRTGSKGTATIEFTSGAIAELEPDTVIQIEDTGNGLNLDFLVGNLTIHAAPNSDPSAALSGLTVKSGDQRVEVRNADVALGKINSGAQLDLDVIKGDAQVLGKMPVLGGHEKLKIIHPRRDEVFYAEPGKKTAVNFDWSVSGENLEGRVALETGPDRHALKLDPSVKEAPLKAGHLVASLPPGKTYFRLVWLDHEQNDSATSVVELKPKYPPILLEPQADAQIPVLESDNHINFLWANHGDLVDLQIEISRSPDFASTSSSVISQKTQSATSANVKMFPGPATYYWRVSGQIPNTSVMIASRSRSFSVGREIIKEIDPPQLLEPSDNQLIPVANAVRDGVTLSWSPLKNATEYEIKIFSAQNQIVNRTGVEPHLTIKTLKPGTYRWQVIAKKSADDKKFRVSKPSETRAFQVEEEPVIEWADHLLHTKQFFKVIPPVSKFSWEKGPGEPASFRIRTSKSRAPASEVEWKATTETKVTQILEGPGLYFINVESLDAQGRVLARSPQRTLQLEMAPLLEPPEFVASMPESIATRADGSCSLAWNEVNEAKGYSVDIQNVDGESVQSVKVDSTEYDVKGLTSGQYRVSLRSIDSFGRAGKAGEKRTLSVPEFSSVAAPKIKSVKVH